MGVEGVVGARDPDAVTIAGAIVFTAGKALKYWAIAALGPRWSYRVFLVPGAPLVTTGPYRVFQHPNYVGVLGELVGMALLTGARWTGPVMTLYFSWLLLRRMTAENRALGIR
jgi:methyltransferase